ncbi:hypothetical protein [Mycobacterium phage WXIN]|nr:hypothetical protein [Mycobacterium phage WXIN]
MTRVESAARILYLTYNSDGYGRNWANALDKPRWRSAAEALLQAVEEGL